MFLGEMKKNEVTICIRNNDCNPPTWRQLKYTHAFTGRTLANYFVHNWKMCLPVSKYLTSCTSYNIPKMSATYDPEYTVFEKVPEIGLVSA